MPKLKPIHYKKFEKFLIKQGCRFIRQKGDHRVYYKNGLLRPLVIPAVKEIPVFVIRNNLRILGIEVKEYLKIIEHL